MPPDRIPATRTGLAGGRIVLEMTDLERLKLQQQALADQIATAERAQLEARLRSALAQLQDESLPIFHIIERALGSAQK